MFSCLFDYIVLDASFFRICYYLKSHGLLAMGERCINTPTASRYTVPARKCSRRQASRRYNDEDFKKLKQKYQTVMSMVRAKILCILFDKVANSNSMCSLARILARYVSAIAALCVQRFWK